MPNICHKRLFSENVVKHIKIKYKNSNRAIHLKQQNYKNVYINTYFEINVEIKNIQLSLQII